MFQVSTILPIVLYSLRPLGRVAAIYCKVKSFSGMEIANHGYRIRGFNDNGLYALENNDTGNFMYCEREDIKDVKVFVTWEI